MSQHHFTGDRHGLGLPVSIMMGWDRPLQGYHLTITVPGGKKPLYCNLDDREFVAVGGLAPSLDSLIPKLEELGLTVPQRMLDEIRADAAQNVGNRQVHYNTAGDIVARNPASGG